MCNRYVILSILIMLFVACDHLSLSISNSTDFSSTINSENDSSSISSHLDSTFWYDSRLAEPYDGFEAIMVNPDLFGMDYNPGVIGPRGKLLASLTANDDELFMIDVDSIDDERLNALYDILLYYEHNGLNPVYAKDYFSSDSSGYTELDDKDIIFWTNKKYNPLVTTVKYTEYITDCSEPNPIWTDYFRSKLNSKAGYSDTPIVIRCSWEFTYNEKHYAFVIANNMVLGDKGELFNNKKETSIVIPYGENHVIYNESTLFIDGVPAWHDIFQNIQFQTIEEIQINKNDTLLAFSPADDYNLGSYFHSCYQSDKDGNLISCPLYLNNVMHSEIINYAFYDTIRLIDLTGDGSPEMILQQKGKGGYLLSVYDLSSFHVLCNNIGGKWPDSLWVIDASYNHNSIGAALNSRNAFQ